MNSSMKLRFGGDSHQIDANTLINYLIHYQAVVEQTNQVLGNGSKKITVRINAVEKGSFVVNIELVESFIKTLFSSDSMGYAASVVAVVSGVYATYKHFRGKPVTDDRLNEVRDVVKCGDNAVVQHIVNVYNAPVTRQAVSKSFETVEMDESVQGVSIESDSDKVEFERGEFKPLQYNDFSIENEIVEDRVMETEASLVILSLGFEAGSRWTFLYNGVKIAMLVKDDALMNRIDNGARFGKGDRIRVKMKITQKYLREVNAYQDSSYKITEFYEHIPYESAPKFL